MNTAVPLDLKGDVAFDGPETIGKVDMKTYYERHRQFRVILLVDGIKVEILTYPIAADHPIVELLERHEGSVAFEMSVRTIEGHELVWALPYKAALIIEIEKTGPAYD